MIAPIHAPAPAPSATNAPLKEVAREMEAMFVRQMLAAARSERSDDSIGAGPGTKQFEAMLDEHVASLAAERGAFGMAELIAARLGTRSDA